MNGSLTLFPLRSPSLEKSISRFPVQIKLPFLYASCEKPRLAKFLSRSRLPNFLVEDEQ